MCILQCLGYCPKSYVRVLTQSDTLTIAREKAAKALKEEGETPEELLRSIKENEAAVAEAQRVVDAWKAIVGEKSRREEASKAEAERIAAEKAEEARVEAERKAEEERKTKEEERKERDENGQPFVVSSDGTTTFGEITEDTGLTAAPIKLSEGVADEMGNGYGLRHIEARHGDQIRKAGFSSVEEFIEQVAKNYDVIKEGSDRNGNKTYRLLLTDKHNNTLMIELSKDGSYWNVNTAGVFKKSYGKDKKEVYNRHTTVKQSAETAETSQADEHSGTQSTSRMNVPTTSADKGTTLPADQQTSDKENTKKVADSEGENTLKAKIEAASAEVNTEPTEAQKEAGNYKKGHVQVGTFDITIEQPEGSIRRGTDADGKKWEIKMHNTYGYFRGTEGVDGDHIDVFLSNDIDGWNGRKVFVVDQYNPDGTFDEHKVMLGFNDMDEAKSDYLANYEKGWENGRRITVSTTNLEDFEKWIDSSHRKTKPFSEYSSVNKETVATDKGGEKAEKKQEKQSVFDKAKEIADKEEKKRKAEADKPKQKPLTEAERKDAEEVAGALGYRVEWVDTMEENGTIDADKKVIRIAKDAENPLVQVLGHEVAHGVKRMDGGKFKALQKAAMEVVGEKEWNERIERKRKLNAYAEGKLAEEVTYDIVGEALNDKDALKRLAESLRGEKGIFARLRDAVARMVEYFKNRGDKEGVRRMKAADKLLAEFESALKEGANERRLSPDTPIRLVNADADHGFKNYEEARAWAKENIARTYGNDETGGKGEIRISNTAIGKFLSEKAVGKSESKDVHLAVLRVLPDVIRESVDAEQHADYRKGADGKRGGNGVNPDVTMHILYGAVTIDGKTYRVKTTLKENVRDNEPTKAYTYEATKIELLAGPNEKATVSTFSRDSNNSITAAKLLKDVKKSYSNEEFFADENVERSVMEKGELTDAEVAEKERDIDHSVRSSKEMAEERLEIERKAKSDGTWLKAPNGKRTNLNERQWVDVRTKNFKEWFGDWENDPENASKIVDENGEPLMVFHYTPEDFTVFGEGKEIGASTFYNASDANYAATAAVGDWFTSKSDLPDYMGKPMRVFLNIKEPSDGRSLEVLADEVGYEISSKDYEAFDEDRDNTAPIIEAGKNYQEKLRDLGYDGIFIADEEFGGTSYITFAPNQIKSAVENDGSYSPKENDIRRSVREKKEDEKAELTAEERELRDNLVERMRKGGLDVVTDSEEMQRVIDTENERTRMMGAGSVREHRVYHGSGADFDAFDHSHMGEGEGAQAYGWGTYVTEVEGIGKTYANATAHNYNKALRPLERKRDSIRNSLRIEALELDSARGGLRVAVKAKAKAEENYEEFLKRREEIEEKYGKHSTQYDDYLWNSPYAIAVRAIEHYENEIKERETELHSLQKDLEETRKQIENIAKEFPRHLYTVEIPDDNGSNYLDWNEHPAKSLLKDVGSFLEGEGFERVQDNPARYEKGESTVVLNPNATGADLYAELREALGSDKKASQALAELGYTGIKYPADNMRGGREDGAKNYVIFNENDAKITDHTRFLRTAGGEVYGLVKDGRIYLDPKVATAETAVHEYTHLWGDMLRRKDSEQWSHTVKELKNSVLWEEVKELYPELKTDDEIADEVLSTFSGRRGAERLREEARRVAEGDGGVFAKAKAIETLERVKEAIARFWEGVARMFGINRYRSAEELADMAMKDLLDSKNPMKDESGMRKRGEVGETLATSGTYFSGGGLLEAGLKGVIDPKVAVEFSEKIAGVYADNHGNHIVVADVRDVDPKKLVGAVDGGEVQYFHASPVCKNFSKAKREGGEVELDKETALSTAEFIAKTRPKVVTIENVKGYRDSEALKIITDELTRQGYDWDADVYNAADYGGYTKRERLIVRAKRDGKLPPKPEKLPEELRKKGWYSAVEDLIPHLEEKKTGVPQGTDERLKNSGIDYRTIDKPLYVFGRGYANKTVGHAFADELLPTLTTGGGDIIIMPDGRVLKASPRVLARVTGLPDTYKMPETDQLSHTIVGNGIPTQLTEGVIAPLLDNAIPSAERATKRESVFDVADRVSQNLEERTRAMGSRVEKRMADVAQKLEGRELTAEQKAVVDVFSGKSDNQKFSVERGDGKKQTYLLKQGNEEKAGAKHSLYRHYGTNTGVITADDVLKIPQVLERGERIEKAKGGKKMAVYTMDVDGAKFTVYTRIGKDYETIDDFYSNKKGSERYVLRNTDGVNNTPEGAHNPDSEPSAKVEDKSESPKLFGEEIIDDGKKGSDSTDRSVRENPKNEDKPRFSRKPGESIFDYASRVSEDVDRSVRERVSARDEYEKKVKSKGFQTKEALQNSMLGLQEFMSAIDHASGNKRYIEDIPDFENPILGENRLSSVNKEEMHQVAKTQFKPLMSAVAKLSGNGKESGELYDYMFAKHGLERDAVMRQREAQKEFDKYQKANPKGTKTIGDFVASLEGKDYAGLTALTAEDGRVKSIQSQIDAIDEQMKATDDQLLLHYLGGQKKRLKVDLLNAARDAADDIRKTFENNPSHDRSDINELWSRVNEVNGNTLRKLYESGMLTKEAYNDISSMYTNYIPMRGFDQTTSADAYAYLTHGDSAFNAPIKTAKGRSSKADNPIAYMQAMAESAIMQGNRNVLVKQKMLNFVRNHPSDLASVSDVWLQYDSVADEWKPFYAFGRESKG